MSRRRARRPAAFPYALSDDGRAFAREKESSDADAIAATELFDTAVVRARTERTTLRAELVIALEHSRATTLSYNKAVRWRFTDELQQILGEAPEVALQQATLLTLAQVLPRP